jgi:predicted phosphodiesterase
MSLMDELMAEPTANEPQYQPRTEYDGSEGFIQTGPVQVSPTPVEYDNLLREFGYDPDEVMIVGSPKISRWQQRARNRDTNEYDTTWLAAYKFSIAAKALVTGADIEDLVGKAKKHKDHPQTLTTPHWFVFQAGDQQLGKKSRHGSTEAIVERYLESVAAAKAEFKALKKHGIEGIQISLPGDCIEGVVSQNSRNMWLTQETITEQVRIFRRLLYHTVEELAPLADQVLVTVVNGNHDQAQRVQNTYPGDGWATECAIAVADALETNPAAFSHVTIQTPDKWRGSLTTTVGDTVVGVIHGHQWNKGKAMDWLAKQAVNRHPAGGAQILQHGHWHAWGIESNREVTVICSPTFEVASDYLIDKNGATAKRGAAVYLLRSGEVSKLSIV